MNDSYLSQRIRSCYIQYCSVIKPLIAQIEASSEKIPLQLFNEIRAFNDHLSRCFYNNPPESYIEEQIYKAERHIVRMTLDCFKCLNVIEYQKIELFETQTKNIDLTVIDNGVFYPDYAKLKVEAAKMVKNAKLIEASDVKESLQFYQKAYNTYTQLTNKIEEISEKVKWAKARFTIRRWLTVIAWVISIIVSAIISAIFSCELIYHFI